MAGIRSVASYLFLLCWMTTTATICSGEVLCNTIDSQALKYFQLEIVFGADEFKTWQDGTDCCRWEGVSCNREGRVESLNIFGSRDIPSPNLPPAGGDPYFVGTGLSDLSGLQSLVMLRIAYNGQIPPSWGKLKNLRVMHLEGCNVIGSIPKELCDLPNLQTLILKGNLLTGIVPACFSKRTGLTHITLLDLDDNPLTGLVPSIPCRSTPTSPCKLHADHKHHRS